MNVRKYFIILLLILCVAISSSQVFATEKVETDKIPSTTLRLTPEEKAWIAKHPVIMSAADYDFPPFSTTNKAGEADGFSVELLRASVKAVGLDVEFYSAPWATIKGELAAGNLDALPVVGRTSEREANFDFTVPYITIYGKVYAREGDNRIRRIEDLEELQVVVKRKDNAEEFANRNQISKNIITLDSFAEAFTLLSKGSYDAIITNEIVGTRVLDNLGIDNVVPVLQIDGFKQDFTFAVTDGNKELLALLNEGLSRVIIDGTYKRLHAKWFGGLKPIQLTPEEKAWLESRAPIVVRVSNFPPFHFMDQGKPAGYSIDLMNRIAALAGFKVRYVSGIPWPEGLEHVRQQDGEVDLLLTAMSTVERREFMAFTGDYLELPSRIFTRADNESIGNMDDLTGKTVAVEKGFAVVKKIRDSYPGINVMEVDGHTPDALRLVSSGDADAYIGNLPVANYHIVTLGIVNLKVAGPTPFGFHKQAFGIRKDWPELVSLLDKALAVISLEDRHVLQKKWGLRELLWEKEKAITLTKEEQAWLAEHSVLRVGHSSKFEPLLIKEADDSFSGIVPDFYQAIGERLGTRVEFVDDEWRPIHQRALEADIDIVGLMNKTAAENLGLLTTKAPFKMLVTAFTKKGQPFKISSVEDLTGLRVAYFKNIIFLNKYFESRHDRITVVEADSPLQAMKLIMKGKADVMIGFQVDSFLLIKYAITDIEPIHVFDELTTDTVAAIRPDAPELVPILAKAFNSINYERRTEMLSKWIWVPEGAEPQVTLPESVPFSQVGFVIQIIAIFFSLILVSVITFWLIRGRPKHLSIRETLFLISFVFSGLIVTIGILVTLLLNGNKKQTAIENHRFDSYTLALELKQSSDDLTRFARTYAVTGDPQFETYFYIISEIRDGLRPHPVNMTHAFWDHITADKASVNDKGEIYAIQSRIRELGLSDEESEKLILAKEESDDLIRLEEIAMNAVKGKFQDANGNFTVHKEPDLKMARMLLHGQAYHDAKSKIMKPIDDFFIQLEGRTTNALNHVRARNNALLLGITILICLTIGFAVIIFFLLRRQIINPLHHLEISAIRFGKGDKDIIVDVEGKNEISQLAEAFNYMLIERKKAEESLMESNLRYSLATKTTQMGIFDWDIKKDVLHLDDGIYSLYGIDKNEFGDNYEAWRKTVHPDDFDRTELEVQQVLRGEKDYDTEFRIVRPDGTIRIIKAYADVNWNDAQEPVRIVGLNWDITELKRAQTALKKINQELEARVSLRTAELTNVNKKLKQSEARYRDIVEDQTEFIMRWQPGGIITFANKAYCDYFGLDKNECVGTGFVNLIEEEDREAVQARIDALTTENQVSTSEHRIMLPSGKSAWNQWTHRAIFDRNGHLLEYQSVGRDVTDRKQAEASLRLSENRLRSLATRLQEVEEEARKALARELHDQVGQSLTALNINLSILHNEMPAEVLNQNIERLEDSIELVEDTTKKIRDVMAELRPSLLDDYGLVAALRWYGNRFSERTGIRVKMQMDEISTRPVESVESALFRIAQEALTNAAKHSNAKRLVLAFEESDNLVRLCISDNGDGFDFKALKNAGIPTGLGILNMKERIQALGGQFDIDSEPGKGTSVAIELRKGSQA